MITKKYVLKYKTLYLRTSGIFGWLRRPFFSSVCTCFSLDKLQIWTMFLGRDKHFQSRYLGAGLIIHPFSRIKPLQSNWNLRPGMLKSEKSSGRFETRGGTKRFKCVQGFIKPKEIYLLQLFVFLPLANWAFLFTFKFSCFIFLCYCYYSNRIMADWSIIIKIQLF